MVAVPDLGADFRRMWQELLLLARRPPAPWTLIGAHMVALHAWKAGRMQPRASRDADILVNARVVSTATQKVSKALIERDFTLDGDRGGRSAGGAAAQRCIPAVTCR